MITVGMNYEVIEGKEQAFEKYFARVVEAMAGAPGHTRTHLYHRVDAPRTYLVMSEWSDKSGFDAFVASDAFRKVTQWGASGILAARPRHDVYGADAPSVAREAGCPAHAAGA
jgi:heme-degrading monooxygenase HmoA